MLLPIVGKMECNTTKTEPSTPSTETNSLISNSTTQNTPVTSVSLPETSLDQPSHKTKDGLIRMLLQTATPSTSQQPKQIFQHGKQPNDTVQSSTELKIHGGALGHYNNGHITQPHPSAIHPIPKLPAQLASGTDIRTSINQMTTKHFTISQSGAGTLINNLPVSATSQINMPNSMTQNLKIDMQASSSAIANTIGGNVIASVVREKILSPNSSTPSDKIEKVTEKVTLHEETPFKLIHQISEHLDYRTLQIFHIHPLPYLIFVHHMATLMKIQ